MCTERSARRDIRWVTTLGTAVLLAACNGTTSYMDATGTAGKHEATLGWWLTAVSCVVVLFVSVAVLLGIARHRNDPHRGDEEVMARREVKSGLSWIYVGVAVSVVILAISFGGTMVTLNAASRPRITPSLTIDVTRKPAVGKVPADKYILILSPDGRAVRPSAAGRALDEAAPQNP